jgi:hypothetical protein
MGAIERVERLAGEDKARSFETATEHSRKIKVTEGNGDGS